MSVIKYYKTQLSPCFLITNNVDINPQFHSALSTNRSDVYSTTVYYHLWDHGLHHHGLHHLLFNISRESLALYANPSFKKYFN